MSEPHSERAELLRKIFDPGTPDDAVRQALAHVLSLELPPPLSHPVTFSGTPGLTGYTVGQESVVDAVHSTVRRVLFGDRPSPVRLNVSLRADGPK